MNIDVFVSYQKDSQKIVENIVAHLENRGIQCWYAPRDIKGNYASHIKQAIDSCAVFLIILNKKASESRHVLNEIDIAFKRSDVAILPFHIADEVNSISDDAQYYLGRIHWVDGTKPEFEDRLKELGQHILDILANKGDNNDSDDITEKNDEQRNIQRLYLSNGTYDGETEFNKPHGKGKLVYNDDERRGGLLDGFFGKVDEPRLVYEGDFWRGFEEGLCKITYKNGNVFEGYIFPHFYSGMGKLTFANGDIYSGSFSFGKSCELGRYIYSCRTRYSRWVDEKISFQRGEAEKINYFFSNLHNLKEKSIKYCGGVYDGEVLDNIPFGKGSLKYGDAFEEEKSFFSSKALEEYNGLCLFSAYSEYEGDFFDGVPHGIGKITYKEDNLDDIISYDGEVKCGIPCGEGTMLYPWGELKGEFKNTHECRGKFVGKDGVIFEGDMNDSTAMGKGKMTWPDGVVLEGEFSLGLLEKGKRIEANGDVYEGVFSCGKLIDGKITYSNGETKTVKKQNP